MFFLHYYCNNLEQNGGGDAVPSVALPYLSLIRFLSNSHTVVYKNLFIVDPNYMQIIKQFRNQPPVCGLYDLSLYLSV